MIGASKDRIIYNKLVKLCKEYKMPVCPVCNDFITVKDSINADYIKTKRGTEIFINTKCVNNYWK